MKRRCIIPKTFVHDIQVCKGYICEESVKNRKALRITVPERTQQEFWTRMQNSIFVLQFKEHLKKAASSFSAIFLEFPLYEPQNTLSYTIVDASQDFQDSVQDEASFSTHLEQAVHEERFAISFPNLSKDTMLFIPAKLNSDIQYTHLKSFIETGDNTQIVELFRGVASYMLSLGPNPKPTYVSTHGLGVYYLHVRVCDKPKYYLTLS